MKQAPKVNRFPAARREPCEAAISSHSVPLAPRRLAKRMILAATSAAVLAGSHPGVAAPDPALMELGKGTYATCMACHGPDGKGIQIPNGPSMAPSLVGSKLATGDPSLFAGIVMKGIKKEDNKFLQVMLPLEGALDDQKLAAVMTYVRCSFGNKAGAVTEEQAKAARAKFKNRKEAFSRKELEKLAK